jgi:FkbM family methyltransferase
MLLQNFRKSDIWAKCCFLIKYFFSNLVPSKYFYLFHFRGWFKVRIYETEIELFNYNTPLETSLFWSKSINETTSLNCFIILSNKATHIVDVGANTGAFCIFGAASNKIAKVIAIEPNFNNFFALKKNVERNFLKINCFNLAATSESKLVTLWDFPHGISYSASLEKEFRQGEGTTEVQVYGVKLDQILNNLKSTDIILLKIDVESHEAEVLKGLSNVIEDEQSNLIFFIELIREDVCREVEKLLKPLNFTYFQIDENSNTFIEKNELSVFNGFNYLIVSKSIRIMTLEYLKSKNNTINIISLNQ